MMPAELIAAVKPRTWAPLKRGVKRPCRVRHASSALKRMPSERGMTLAMKRYIGERPTEWARERRRERSVPGSALAARPS
jgi:hypothetical protein